MPDIFTDILSAVGSENAMNAQTADNQRARDLQQQIYGQDTANLQPWMAAGQQSLGQLMSGMQSGAFNTTVNPQDLQNDPGYQFRMQQAQQALSRSAAAKGTLGSGGFAKSLDTYSQGLASQEYQAAWSRNFAQNQANYNNLANISGAGQNAAVGTGNIGTGYANSMSSLYGALGNSQAAGFMGIYGAVGDAWGDIDRAVMTQNPGALTGSGGSSSSSGGGGGGGGMGMGQSMIPTQFSGGGGGGMGGGDSPGMGDVSGGAMDGGGF